MHSWPLDLFLLMFASMPLMSSVSQSWGSRGGKNICVIRETERCFYWCEWHLPLCSSLFLSLFLCLSFFGNQNCDTAIKAGHSLYLLSLGPLYSHREMRAGKWKPRCTVTAGALGPLLGGGQGTYCAAVGVVAAVGRGMDNTDGSEKGILVANDSHWGLWSLEQDTTRNTSRTWNWG